MFLPRAASARVRAMTVGARGRLFLPSPWGEGGGEADGRGEWEIRILQPSSSSLARRHGRRRAMLAALPAAPAAPLSQKVLRYFLGALYVWSPLPLKKGEGMKREGVCLSIRTAQDFSTRSINRAPENRSGARFLGRGGAALQVEHFAKWQNADSIGE